MLTIVHLKSTLVLTFVPTKSVTVSAQGLALNVAREDCGGTFNSVTKFTTPSWLVHFWKNRGGQWEFPSNNSILVLGVSSHLATRSDKPHQEVYLVHGDPGMVSDTFQKTQTAPHTTSGVLLESGGLIRAAIVHKRNKAAFSKLWVFALTSHTPLLTLPFLP
jgi:hypothetical protein